MFSPANTITLAITLSACNTHVVTNQPPQARCLALNPLFSTHTPPPPPTIANGGQTHIHTHNTWSNKLTPATTHHKIQLHVQLVYCSPCFSSFFILSNIESGIWRHQSGFWTHDFDFFPFIGRTHYPHPHPLEPQSQVGQNSQVELATSNWRAQLNLTLGWTTVGALTPVMGLWPKQF